MNGFSIIERCFGYRTNENFHGNEMKWKNVQLIIKQVFLCKWHQQDFAYFLIVSESTLLADQWQEIFPPKLKIGLLLAECDTFHPYRYLDCY